MTKVHTTLGKWNSQQNGKCENSQDCVRILRQTHDLFFGSYLVYALHNFIDIKLLCYGYTYYLHHFNVNWALELTRIQGDVMYMDDFVIINIVLLYKKM